jgi:FimV-like protein
MAIFRKNPQAFHQNNINRLKVGSMLTIPSPESVDDLDRKRAYSQATEQIDAYEQEVRRLRVQRGELEPLGDAARDPDLATGVTVTIGVTTPSDAEMDEMKQGLANDQPLVLPEPKPPQQARRAEEPVVFRFSYDLAYIHDDNVRLARDDVDIREDNILSGTLKATAGKSLDGFSLLNYGGSVTYNKFETFDGLDNVEFEVNTRYRFALSSGFTSPIYSLKASLGGAEFDSEMRDATLLSLSAEINKWLTTTINMTAGIGINKQESVSEVFDLSDARVFVNFDTNLSDTDLVYTTFSYITGDTVSSATPTLDIINVSDAIEPDDAFGGVDANQFAYRIDSNTAVITLGYNRIMSRDISLDFSLRYVDSEARDDENIYYERTIFRASLLGRF